MLAIWTILTFLGLTIAGLVARAIVSGPRPDVETGLIWHAMRIYVALVHHVRIEGREHMPDPDKPGPLIIVSNHTAGVDPVLIQSVSPFEIRWMMAQDMRMPALEWLWVFARIIFIDRQSRDLAGTREAIRAVKGGEVLGIFPEGGLERPARTILPFQPGVGMIIRRTKAKVLPIVVTGTPIADQAWGSLLKTSRSVLTFHEPIDYSGADWTAETIASDLRNRYSAWTGWPLNDRVPWEVRPAAEGEPAAD